MLIDEKRDRVSLERSSGERSATRGIHVSWNGASDVGDLNNYFGKSESVRKHLDFLDRLSRMLEP
jgi:hypothetical protein